MTSVLIVDDEPGIREVFQSILEEEGYDVTTAADFFEAESALAAHSYDVVVTDIIMPRVNGLTLLRRVREIDASIPVIMITGEPDVDTATDAVRHGAYDYISKPITLDTLTRAVARAVERKQLLDEKRRLEADNRAYRTDLERKVAARTAELEHRNQELAALIEIGRDTSATLDSTEVLKRVTQRAAQVCEAHRCTILLLSKDGKVATPLMSQFSDGHGEWKMWRMFKDMSYPVPVSQVSEAQRVIRERQPLFIPDASASSLPKLLIEPFGVKSVLLVPLISKERVVALMALDRVDVDQEFTSEQMNLAMAIAVQAMVAIENARLFEAERAQLLLARTLQEVGALLTASLSLDEVCQHVFDLLSRVIKYDSVSLQLLGQDNQLSLLVERGFPDPELFSQVARELSDHMLENFAERKVIVIPDTHNNSRWIVVPDLDYIRSWIGAPLLVKGKLIGILNVDSATVNAYDAALGETVMAFANQAAIAIENARLFDEEMSSRRLADTLRQVAQALNSTLSLDDVLGLILTELEKVIPLDSGSIMLLEGKDLIVRSVKGFADPDSVLKVRLDLDTAFLNREVVESKRPLIVGSVHEDRRWINTMKLSGLEPELHDTCSWMGIPLNVKGQVIGMLTTDKREAHFYSERDAQVALTFANQAATAIENARLFGAEQRRRQEAETLCRAAQALATATLDLSQVFERILGELQQVVPYDSASVQLLKGDRLEIIGGRGFPNLQELLGVSFDLSREDNPNREVIRRRVSFIVGDVPAVYSNFRRGPHAAAGIRAWLGVPLLFGDRLIGMLALDKREIGFYTAEHARLAEAFAAQAAIAIENALLFEEAQRELTERKRAEAAFQERAASLELVARVAQRTTAILELDELLHQAVDLISDAFGYYNVVILLVEGDEVVSKAATLPAAQAMEDRLRLRVGKDGITGWVAGSGEPLLVPDVSVDPRYYTATEGIKTKSELAVPIKLKGIVIGVLDVQSAELDAFSQADVFMLETVADQLAVAIGNARLFQDTTRRLNDLSLLHDVALIGAATLDFDQILRRTVESVNSKLQLDTFGFLLIDEEAGLVRLHPAFLGLPDEMADFSIPLGEGITGWVAQTGRSLLVSDVSKEPRYRDAVPGIRSEVCVPLKVGGKVIGVMDAESTQLDAFSEEHVRLFSTLAAQLGMALENARLFEETNHRLAKTRLLQEVMQAVASTLDFDEVLTRVINTLHKSLDIPYLNFAFPDEDKAAMLVHPSMFGFAIPPKDFPRLPLDGSIIGRVYQTGEPLLISNVEQVPYYFEVAPTRSELAVPVRVGDQIIAVLNVESPELGAFGEEDLRILSAVAAQLGIVLENARLFEETKRRLAEARLIQEVMLAAASTLDFNLVLERVVKALNRALGIFHLGFLVPNERNDALVPHSFLADLEEAAFQVSIEGSLLGQAYRTGQPVMVRDLAQEPAYREIVPGARSALAVPVRVGDRIVAVLYAQSPQAGAFDEDELRLFTTIAGQLGVTLENARLYQRLEGQAAELSQAYSELQEINRLRTELVQNVSHELRTPLGLIKGYAALLLGGDLGPVLDSQRMALQVIHDRTVTLTRLIHNLTMLQVLPQEALSLAPLSLVEVVRHALVEFRSLAKKTDITFLDELPEELPPVLGNQEQLGLAFGHLLDNAVKFSPDGGTVTLRAWADQDMVRLLVADEGIGISFEHLNRVFERFYQVDGSTSRRFGGMGVGLALVWEIIEAHGGTVNVESDVGKGSQFIVALPQAAGS